VSEVTWPAPPVRGHAEVLRAARAAAEGGPVPGRARRYALKGLERLSFLLKLRATDTMTVAMRRFVVRGQTRPATRPTCPYCSNTAARCGSTSLRCAATRTSYRQGALPMPGADLSSEPTDGSGEFALLPIHHVQLAIPQGGEPRSAAPSGSACSECTRTDLSSSSRSPVNHRSAARGARGATGVRRRATTCTGSTAGQGCAARAFGCPLTLKTTTTSEPSS